MILLAIDTANWPLGVAVMEDGKLLGEVNTQLHKNHSVRLMPTVEWLCEQIHIKPGEINGVAVAKGPGSYTGVRIGVTTAKVMAWSLRIPLIGISSLQIIAQNRMEYPGLIVPIIDARRGQVYTGAYRKSVKDQIVIPIREDRLVLVDDLCHELQHHVEHILFIGEGVRIHQDFIQSALGEQAVFAGEIHHPPRAGQLAYIAWKQWEQRMEDPETIHAFSPDYLQLAEAEAKWLEKQGKGEKNV